MIYIQQIETESEKMITDYDGNMVTEAQLMELRHKLETETNEKVFIRFKNYNNEQEQGS